MVKGSAGGYFASFVVETDRVTLPVTESVAGIDLRLTYCAVLSDGTKTDSPRFLRRAEEEKAKQNPRGQVRT
ncbi:hypothetical protein ACIQVR_37980 [Streptomyces xanthochromogenes]|uniref:hypothetical protein n=1 Tax=Streptomyces xanthochromogenes TaxID=67384 RepID=UPI00382C716F